MLYRVRQAAPEQGAPLPPVQQRLPLPPGTPTERSADVWQQKMWSARGARLLAAILLRALP